MHGAEFGNEVGGVFGGVYGEGAGDYEEGLGEFTDGELFAGALYNFNVTWFRGKIEENGRRRVFSIELSKTTYHSDSEFFEVDVKSSLHCTPTGDYTPTFESSLDS